MRSQSGLKLCNLLFLYIKCPFEHFKSGFMLNKISTVVLVVLFAATSVFGQRNQDRGENHAIRYGSDILRLAPITAMDIGVGFGLSYEKILGKEQMIGLVFPVSLILQSKNNNYVGANGSDIRYNKFVYFTPGVKIYPFGQRRVTYAVGPNLLLGYGGGKEAVYDYSGNIAYPALREVEVTRLRLGMLINNYVNFQITPTFNLGLEGGLGMRYYDKESYSGSIYTYNNNYNNGFDITGQFSLTLGLRF
jgi:hypothetical protein